MWKLWCSMYLIFQHALQSSAQNTRLYCVTGGRERWRAEERKMKGQTENKRADCSETKQGQSSSVTLVPRQAVLCSTWELNHTHTTHKIHRGKTEREQWWAWSDQAAEFVSEEGGDREVIQWAIHNVWTAGTERNLEPVQHTEAVVLNCTSGTNPTIIKPTKTRMMTHLHFFSLDNKYGHMLNKVNSDNTLYYNDWKMMIGLLLLGNRVSLHAKKSGLLD